MRWIVLPSLALIALASSVYAADPRVDAAVDKAAGFIKAKQDPADGQFKDKWSHAYPMGETALSLLALLKAGVASDDPIIKRGFKAMMSLPFKKIYSVSIGILAIEARYAPDAETLAASGDPYRSVARKRFKKKARGADKRWLTAATRYLCQHQGADGLWAYPFNGDRDVSNAQFALLGLKSSKRLGIAVPDQIWLKSLKGLLAIQERSGPVVPPFSVPAAEGPIRLLEGKSSAGAEGTTERATFRARGWGYKGGDGARGSMTAAGVACLVVLKSELERRRGFDKKWGPAVDQALRDGSAWLASRFRADANPGAELDWLFYYLYTLERAGTLSGAERFGDHAWHRAGTDHILSLQHGDGRFEKNGGNGEKDGSLAGTCLAVLFLKRSTVPVIEREATGSVDVKPEPGAAGGLHKERLVDGRFEVTFRFKPDRAGSRVAVAGSFNSWSKDSHVLTDSDGDGLVELKLILRAGEYTYKYVIDGQTWITDPKNPAKRADGNGNTNSLLKLE